MRKREFSTREICVLGKYWDKEMDFGLICMFQVSTAL